MQGRAINAMQCIGLHCTVEKDMVGGVGYARPWHCNAG